MKFSVITIVRNDVANIMRTISSITGQSYPNVEYIIINGGSTDGTTEVIDRVKTGISIHINEKDKGIYDAMNKGINNSTGDYIIFMNSGDCFSSANVLADMALKINGDRPALAYGDYNEYKGKILIRKYTSRPYSKIWWGPVASHQSTFYNLHFLHTHQLNYDLSYRIAADYKLTLEVISMCGGNILRTDICVSDFDISGASNINQDIGLDEANRARMEVLGWSWIKCLGLKSLLLGARYTKRYARPLYNLLRK